MRWAHACGLSLLLAVAPSCARPTPRGAGGATAPHERAERADRDHDGLDDARDRCPDQPEDRDGFQDEDGCPDLDDDGDRIADADDECPREPEIYNGYRDEDGCPDSGKAPYVEELRILAIITFGAGSARLEPQQAPVLDALASTLARHPALVTVVVGHEEASGSTPQERGLSRPRAEAVVDALVARGVERRRLPLRAVGALCPGSTSSGASIDRYVSFGIVVDPDGKAQDDRYALCPAAVAAGIVYP